ncbi:Unknown protein [Striga hermonthica]|uniref:Uncharacterized protein n=1 Tax=Striga hermonthica TaxID=68872 RepID=A0A9N7N445_STRHE|nr:Unknown protein [Striga hermonthica]
MNSGLTELEMGAVLELIQLSGGGGGFPVLWVDYPAEKDGSRDKRSEEEKSAGESLSSSSASSIEPAISASTESLPRRRKRLRSLADIYLRTRPLENNRGNKKRARF